MVKLSFKLAITYHEISVALRFASFFNKDEIEQKCGREQYKDLQSLKNSFIRGSLWHDRLVNISNSNAYTNTKHSKFSPTRSASRFLNIFNANISPSTSACIYRNITNMKCAWNKWKARQSTKHSTSPFPKENNDRR